MVQLIAVAVLAGLYVAAVLRVRRRRGTVDRKRALSFGCGVALLAAGVAMPDNTFARHMAQHLLIGDLAPLCLVLGLSGPLLRPALALRPVRALRVLSHPLVALPVWAVDLCAWHVAPLFDAALHHEPVHALQHVCFFTAGAMLWASLLQLLPGPRWFRTPQRLAYLGGMWLVSLVLSQLFIWSSRPFYDYRSANDQRIGGGIMLVEGSAVMLSVLVWLLWDALVRSETYRGATQMRG
jgi:putative membrane protein